MPRPSAISLLALTSVSRLSLLWTSKPVMASAGRFNGLPKTEFKLWASCPMRSSASLSLAVNCPTCAWYFESRVVNRASAFFDTAVMSAFKPDSIVLTCADKVDKAASFAFANATPCSASLLALTAILEMSSTRNFIASIIWLKAPRASCSFFRPTKSASWNFVARSTSALSN